MKLFAVAIAKNWALLHYHVCDVTIKKKWWRMYGIRNEYLPVHKKNLIHWLGYAQIDNYKND